MDCKKCGASTRNKYGYCSDCRNYCHYSMTKEFKLLGPSDGKSTFGFEFETQHEYAADPQAQFQLLDYDFIRTEDSTVDDEWKSPIYQGMEPFKLVLPLLDTLADHVGTECGTHTHVAISDRSSERLWRMSDSILNPLRDYMREYRSSTVEFWGRYFGSYRGTNNGSWIRANYGTLEWRIAKFISAEQFERVVVFCRDTTEWLDQRLVPLVNPTNVGNELLHRYTQAVMEM